VTRLWRVKRDMSGFGYDGRMCGRLTLRTPLAVLAKQFEFDLEAAMGDVRTLGEYLPSPAVTNGRSSRLFKTVKPIPITVFFRGNPQP